jgi:hypothetical protein
MQNCFIVFRWQVVVASTWWSLGSDKPKLVQEMEQKKGYFFVYKTEILKLYRLLLTVLEISNGPVILSYVYSLADNTDTTTTYFWSPRNVFHKRHFANRV